MHEQPLLHSNNGIVVAGVFAGAVWCVIEAFRGALGGEVEVVIEFVGSEVGGEVATEDEVEGAIKGAFEVTGREFEDCVEDRGEGVSECVLLVDI